LFSFSSRFESKIGDNRFVSIICLCSSKLIFSNLSKYQTQAFMMRKSKVSTFLLISCKKDISLKSQTKSSFQFLETQKI